MKLKGTITQEIDLEISTPAYFKYGASFLFLKNEKESILISKLYPGVTDIRTGKQAVNMIHLYATEGEKITASIFRDKLILALEEIQNVCPDNFIADPVNYLISPMEI